MGSSKVSIWYFLLWFIKSTMEARVVDLPLPVGPVTNIRPLGSMDKSFTIGGIPNSSIVGIVKGIILRAIPKLPLCLKTLILNLPTPELEKDISSSPFSSRILNLSSDKISLTKYSVSFGVKIFSP